MAAGAGAGGRPASGRDRRGGKGAGCLRETWLNPEGASEAELKTRTLTNLYTARPTWLANAHAALDRAVWDAYGWPADEVPAEVAEDVILSWLLALNQAR